MDQIRGEDVRLIRSEGSADVDTLFVLASQSALAQNQRSSHNSSALRSRLNLEASEVGGLSDSVPAPLAGRSGASRRSGSGATLLGCPPGLSLSLRHRASTPVRQAACCADAFLWLSSRAFCVPAGGRACVVMMCHCVRHISLDNKHGRSVEAIHSRHVTLDGLHRAPCQPSNVMEMSESLQRIDRARYQD